MLVLVITVFPEALVLDLKGVNKLDLNQISVEIHNFNYVEDESLVFDNIQILLHILVTIKLNKKENLETIKPNLYFIGNRDCVDNIILVEEIHEALNMVD